MTAVGAGHGADALALALFDVLAAVALGAAAAAYAVGLCRSSHRSPWPARRAAAWYLALVCAAAGLLNAHPPAGVDVGDGRVGVQLMYYGGDVVDVIIIVLLLAGWYTSTDPHRRRASYPPSGQVSKAASG